jgi:PAS domain S-box-containing protein
MSVRMPDSIDLVPRAARTWLAPGLLVAGAGFLAASPASARRLLSSDEFMPHGHCYFWRSELIWLHAVSDGLIALAYFSIPVALLVLVHRRRDLPFNRVFMLFGAFVMACGSTHVMDVWTLWVPTYWLAGALKAVTAIVSIASAIVLARTLPRALLLPDRLKEVTVANARLQASEERLRLVIEESPIGMVVVDQSGLLALVNGSVEKMFGYARYELLGQPVERVIPKRFQSAHPDQRATFARNPSPRAMGAGRELWGQRKDGSEIPIEIGLTQLPQEGATTVLATVLDISERKRAETLRRETYEALQSFHVMVERVKDYAIFQLDGDGNIRTWNAGARAIKGYEADEVIGKHIAMFYPADARSKPAEELRIAAEAGRYEDEGFRVRKDGSLFWANVVITAVRDEATHGVLGFVKVTRDLTERKRAQDAQAAALRERTALLQEVHHRVKNNLQMIASLLNLQGRQITDPSARRSFAEARDRVRSIALLHESLYQSADLGRVDMREYVRKLVQALQQTSDSTGHASRIVDQVEGVIFPVDTAVPCGLIIHELLVNALKHAFPDRPSSDPRSEIRIRLSEGPEMCTLVVDDNGVGFSADVDPEQDETLGLTLVRDLTSQLQGTVVFRSEAGARCTIVFPPPSRPADVSPLSGGEA